MPLNTNLLRAPAAIEFPDQVNRLAQFSQIQNAQNQNALAQYQLGAAQRAEAEAEGVKNYFAGAKDFESPEFQRGLMAVSPGKGLEYAKAVETTKAQRASTGLHEAQTREIVRKLTDAGEAKAVNDLLRLNSSDDARAALQTAVANKEITPEKAALIAKTLPIDQAQFPNWKQKTLYSMLTPAQQLEMTTTSQDTGGGTRMFQTPKFAGGAISAGVVPGSEVTKTATPDALLADARLKAQHIDQLAHWNDLTDIQRQQLKRQYNADALQDARSRAQLAETIANNARVDRREAERIAQANNPGVVATTLTDAAGNVRQLNKFGQSVGEVMPGVGKPSATFEKTAAQKKQLALDLDRIIPELENAVKPGGLIETSTGSGIGKLADETAAFFGQSTKGAIAAGQLQPIYDMVLKTVPRFEGPQSNADTKSYERAAGDIGNPAIPAPRKLAAAKEILRLLKARKDQFATRDMVESGGLPSSGGGVKFLGFE